MEAKHCAEFCIHLHHLGPDGRARPSLWFDCFQNAASQQSACLGLSIRDLIQRGLTWVVSRYRLKVLRPPGWRERIRVVTWRSTPHGRMVPREFSVIDEKDRLIAMGQGIFMLLDYATRQPVSPTGPLAAYPVVDETVFTEAFTRLPALTAPLNPPVKITVRRDDLDLNRHVNNTRYMVFALESIPDEIQDNLQPDRIDVVFKASARLGDIVKARVQKMDGPHPTFLHQLVRQTDGQEFCRLLTRWRPPT
ncbi:putative Acyl-ACP thioesterase [Desulfosarcina cetonica]|uniref:acyl-[acyl-carrier-protein] thioesterase n=1 Tax=Desulfosarcina cetonica TaxID=90730 RepID=UPI0006D13B2F|nr:acyl-ACP thioesterase domain-containing protein [Desulfosarcina cetonica]VTR63942.1 putative Acyl-ACP thioesterase [Desulfosarcina cetonica]